MTEPKLDLANELKAHIYRLLKILSMLDVLERLDPRKTNQNPVVITDYNNGSICLPESLKLEVIRVVREYYTSELQEVKKQFDEL